MQANLVRSLLSNMHSVESDCPTRERVGWTGDAQATALGAVRNLDMAGFYAKWVADMTDALHPDGGLSSTVRWYLKAVDTLLLFQQQQQQRHNNNQYNTVVVV